MNFSLREVRPGKEINKRKGYLNLKIEVSFTVYEKAH